MCILLGQSVGEAVKESFMVIYLFKLYRIKSMTIDTTHFI